MHGCHVLDDRLALAPGENRRDFDLRERFPGAIDVVARVNGAPAAGLAVQAQSVEPESFSSALVLDANGRGTLRPLAPGTYRIEAHPIEDAWRHSDPAAVRVAPNGTTAFVLEIQVADGSLLVIDAATRAALANQDLWLGLDTSGWPERQVRTDAEGRLRTRLTLGRYKLWAGAQPFGGTPGPSFDWTSAGPVPARVELAR